MNEFSELLLENQFNKTTENNVSNIKTVTSQKNNIYKLNDEEIIINKKTNFISNPNYSIDAALDLSSLSTEDINKISEGLYRQIQTQDTLVNISKDYTESSTEKNYISSNDTAKIVNGYETSSSISDNIENSINLNNNFSGNNNTTSSLLDQVDKENEESKSAIEKIKDIIKNISSAVDGTISSGINSASTAVGDTLNTISNTLDGVSSSDSGKIIESITNVTSNIVKVVRDTVTAYQDGVSETSFGMEQEKNNKKFKSENSSKLNYLKTSFISGNSSNIYGSKILGTPFSFNSNSDPNNRTLINTLIKDGKILTLTPGLPEFHATSYDILGRGKNDKNIKNNMSSNEMLSYLKKNGLDANFSSNDKRYYTFKTDYDLYYQYLETMLNVLWVKMGLSSDGKQNSKLNLFDFSNEKSSFGFYTNIIGTISESIDNSKTSFGSEAANNVNSMSDNYQKLNYIHGMGTGSTAHNAARGLGIGVQTAKGVVNLLSGAFSNTISSAKSIASRSGIKGKIAAIANTAISLADDTNTLLNTQDLGSVMQSFATSNGMKVVYPELWSDTDYSKNMNFNFTFMSPYGDPLSIFKYVYYPFCALLCYAMPRQAAENGFVSPFFIRGDVPGLFTCDLGMVSSMTWTKGGSANLWTKDGLPRAIDVSISITDLYPYLSMTSGIGSLSGNPSYAVFLDNLSGMLTRADDSDEKMTEYFSKLIERVNGISDSNSVWNKFNSTKSKTIKNISSNIVNSINETLDPNSIPWIHNSSIS